MGFKKQLVDFIQMSRKMSDQISTMKGKLSASDTIINKLNSADSFLLNKIGSIERETAYKLRTGLNDVANKYVLAQNMLSKYPDVRDKILSDEATEGELDAFNIPIIAVLMALIGGVMTSFYALSQKIKMQNDYLNSLDSVTTSYIDGSITAEALTATVKGLKRESLGNVNKMNTTVVIGVAVAIFAGYYLVFHTDTVDKILHKAKKSYKSLMEA